MISASGGDQPVHITPPVPLQPDRGLNLNVSASAPELPGWFVPAAQFGASGSNILTSVLNYYQTSAWMGVQSTVAQKYYETQDKLAGYQKEVAIRQLEVQDNAILTQKDMHMTQTRHEETMARLEGHTQARLARIGEDGRTERARILSVSNAFSRRGWDMGMPIAA